MCCVVVVIVLDVPRLFRWPFSMRCHGFCKGASRGPISS
jgi:hypothetical protein